ncbi:hypothetical protein K438DRAFT_1964438 [Mycena galopus ATCC 62051]|nr:hypothetical protein K438DRAFT_1964438 [Mycena galopus ATCC 62051]
MLIPLAPVARVMTITGNFNLTYAASTATYSVDGGAATTFAVQGFPNQGTSTKPQVTLNNVPMFSIDDLAPGTHSVLITYEGDAFHMPLALDVFYVSNSTAPVVSPPPFSPSSSALASSSTSTASSSPSSSTSAVSAAKHIPTGTIAGGVGGGLALIALLTGLLLWLRSRSRRRQRERELGDTPTHHCRDSSFALETADLDSGASTSLGPAYASLAPDPFDPYVESSDGSTSLGVLAPRRTKSPTPQRRVLVQRHRDSGVRLRGNNSTPSLLAGAETVEVVDVPPDYRRD